MRLFGAALVVLAGVLMGLQRLERLRRDVQRRTALCRMLEGLSYELRRFRTPLPEAFSALCAQSEGAALHLCGTVSGLLSRSEPMVFSEAWARALEQVPLREREILSPLGGVLGCYGTEEQLSALDRCRRDMERLLSEGRDCLRERGRVCVGLWAAAGLMTAVVLI